MKLEDNRNWRWPNGRWPKWKTTKIEVNLNGGRQNWRRDWLVTLIWDFACKNEHIMVLLGSWFWPNPHLGQESMGYHLALTLRYMLLLNIRISPFSFIMQNKASFTSPACSVVPRSNSLNLHFCSRRTAAMLETGWRESNVLRTCSICSLYF